MKKILKKYKCLKNQAFFLEDYSLITIQEDDIDDVRLWRNAQLKVLRQAAKITSKNQKEYFSNFIWPSMKKKNPDNILFSFFYKNKKIGYGGLVHITWGEKTAELSFLLNPIGILRNYEKYFLYYLELIARVAFKDLKFNKIFTETYSFRKKHIGILEKFGFKKKYILKNNLIVDGRYYHSVFHEIINNKKNV